MDTTSTGCGSRKISKSGPEPGILPATSSVKSPVRQLTFAKKDHPGLFACYVLPYERLQLKLSEQRYAPQPFEL